MRKRMMGAHPRRFLILVLAVGLSGCTSIQSTVYPTPFESPSGKVNGIVQVNRSTLTLFFDLVDLTKIDWDTTTQLLLPEVTVMGGKPQIVSAHTSPRAGWWALLCFLACVNSTEMTALAVEAPANAPTSASAPGAP